MGPSPEHGAEGRHRRAPRQRHVLRLRAGLGPQCFRRAPPRTRKERQLRLEPEHSPVPPRAALCQPPRERGTRQAAQHDERLVAAQRPVRVRPPRQSGAGARPPAWRGAAYPSPLAPAAAPPRQALKHKQQLQLPAAWSCDADGRASRRYSGGVHRCGARAVCEAVRRYAWAWEQGPGLRRCALLCRSGEEYVRARVLDVCRRSAGAVGRWREDGEGKTRRGMIVTCVKCCEVRRRGV